MTDPKLVAQELLAEQGPPEAWQHATRKAIDAHLRQDSTALAHWAAVQEHLSAIARYPQAGDLDVYRSARSLVGEQGLLEAWRHAMQQAADMKQADLRAQAYWLRVADAITALAKSHGERHS